MKNALCCFLLLVLVFGACFHLPFVAFCCSSLLFLVFEISLVSIWTFFAFRCSFWFFVPTKSHNEQCDAQMETSTKNQNEQQKAITSNKRHLPVLVFEIELILSQKQERATKSSKRQRTANGNMHQKPKQATKATKSIFHSHFHSFAPVLDQWKVVYIKSNEKPERATTGNEKQ